MQDRLSEILFRSYFTDGVYPGEDNLLKLGVEAGLAEAEVGDFLDTEELRAEVFAEDQKVKQAGVHGETGERRDGQRPSLLPSGRGGRVRACVCVCYVMCVMWRWDLMWVLRVGTTAAVVVRISMYT